MAAILEAPDRVQALHRRYAEIGCDIVTTNTWGLATAIRDGGRRLLRSLRPGPLDGHRPPRRPARPRGDGRRPAAPTRSRSPSASTARSTRPTGSETIRLLARAFEADPPDLILLETLSLVRSSTYSTIESLLATGLPLWLGFRRCRHGVCGVYGEHWGGPEGDAFGRAARRFEELGVGALLINCIPPDHATGMLSWLRDFTDLPLGVYPNLGYLSAAGWRHDAAEQPDYAELALAWREEGAQIIGGCCGVGPDRIAAAGAALADTRPGHRRIAQSSREPGRGARRPRAGHASGPIRRAGRCTRCRSPTSPSTPASPARARRACWSGSTSSASRSRPGAAASTSAASAVCRRSRSPSAAPRTCTRSTPTRRPSRTRSTNAYRNGVAGVVSAAAVDLYPWVPQERYEVIVATLSQMPLDPFGPPLGHRPFDYWGRNLIDHLIRLLPEALAPGGTALLTQLSIIGARRTIENLERAGFASRIVDYGFVGFGDLETEPSEQIERVEASSDAYHIKLGDRDMMVAYLIEITRAGAEGAVNGAERH